MGKSSVGDFTEGFQMLTSKRGFQMVIIKVIPEDNIIE